MNDREFETPRTSERDYSVWVGAGIALLIIAAIGVWALRGPTPDTNARGGTSLTGQAASKSGSTTVGAPLGTRPKETTGQASAPSGTTTTGAPK